VSQYEPKSEQLKKLLAERILCLDGAMGTSLQNLDLTIDDFGGPALEGCNENLVLTRPDVIEGVHRSFLEAGADIVETDTFGSTPLVLAEYGLEDRAREISRIATEIARKAVDAFSTDQRPRFVAGSIGPTTKTISVTGGVTWDELVDSFRIQALGLIEGGSDFLLVETSQDTINIKAALEGIDRANAELGTALEVAVQGTVETMGTLLAGQDVEALYVSLAHRNLLWIGLNCATGPDFMTDHLRTLAELSRFPVACIPNAGLPDEDGNYNETPEMLAAKLAQFADNGWVNVVGGCCGTVPEHIAGISKAVADKTSRQANAPVRSVVSGIEAYEIDDEKRPVIVGERTNVLGSRKFKRLIAEGKIDEAAEVGRAQVRKGAAIVDVCLQDPDRDELTDVTEFLEILVKKVKVPIMVDSTDPEVVEECLKRLQGKSIINSINLEEGEEKFERVTPLMKRYGAAAVVGCIDDDPEQAQAITRERKLEVAQRSYDLLTTKYGIPGEDIIFDPLVFPVGTGDENYSGSGVEVIEGIRLIKQAMPETKTVLGISNVSFGLPPAGREVLNSVFLHHCVEAGLDLAIVNAEMLAPYSRISEEERKLCDDLIWWRGDDPIAAFADHFADKKVGPTEDERKHLSVDERLALYILEGSRDGLVEDLEEKRKTHSPLQIVNGPLMDGMDEVGRRFNANEMIVAEVLQSAEAMKAAVGHLEQFMEKSESSVRGKIVLATVKGDVHDIGKNLVEIILANNGYEVVNLGIKIPPEELIAAYEKHKPDAIGLSGLLVKSAQQMVTTAKDLRSRDIDCPILVGGAALSSRFTRLRIAPEYAGLVAYAKDAMTGLDLAKKLGDEQARSDLATSLQAERDKMIAAEDRKSAKVAERPAGGFSPPDIVHADTPRTPPDLKRHVVDDFELTSVFRYINPQMLYVRHLGFKGKFEDALAAGNEKALELKRAVEEVEDEILRRDDIRASAVYQFFVAAGKDDSLLLLSPDGKSMIGGFEFGRQHKDGGLCLSDYVAPQGSGKRDFVAMFATTIGPGVRELSERWKQDGDYLRSHIVAALALEAAEGLAELLHERIRTMWGIGDPPETTKKDLFQARYEGVRVSFGYPACPRLEDQAELFRILDPAGAIGVELTDGFMMDPESSVSALVFSHPQAGYFSLSEADQQALEARLAETDQAAGA
jgi:5-methyltetrahydrofolate--homocysteine methyltransferase